MFKFADQKVAPRFWELIDTAKSEEARMKSILQRLNREDLVRFRTEFDYSVSDLVDQVVDENCGDTWREQEIAGWVVSRGLSFYAGVFDHPERFPRSAPDGETNFFGLAEVVFEEQFPDALLDVGEEDRWPTVRGEALLKQFGTDPSAH